MSDNDVEILEENSFQQVPVPLEFYKKHNKIFTVSNFKALERILDRCNVDTIERLEDNIGKTRSELDQATQWYNYEAGCHQQYKTNFEHVSESNEELKSENKELKSGVRELEKALKETREAYGKCAKDLFGNSNRKDGNWVVFEKPADKNELKEKYIERNKYEQLKSDNLTFKSVNTQLKQRIAKLEIQLAKNKGNRYYK